MQTLFWLIAFARIAASAGFAQSPDRSLTAEVQPLAFRSRSEAPAFVDVKLHSRRAVILEGSLELEVMAADRLLWRQRTTPLALAPGVTNHRLLLPPVAPARGDGLEVQLRFATAKTTHDLGRFPVAAESFGTRDFLIGICGTEPSLRRDQRWLWQALRPDSSFQDSAITRRHIASTPVWFAPADLPSSIGLCAFDLVIVEGPAFGALSERQLAQLGAWVEGGGSLCVVPQSPLAKEHLSFLNTLADRPDRSPTLAIEPNGKLILDDGPIVLRRSGLGRLMITLAPPTDEAELATTAWRRASMVLARFPASYVESGAPNPATLGPRSRTVPPERAGKVQELLSKILPRKSRHIPPPILVGLLAAFVLLVGPGEWFFLGWLRRRRWTWITFPASALAFTFLTVRTAEYFLGREEQRAVLVITDVGRGGRPLRENRFDLWFSGRNKDVVSELRQRISIPLRIDRNPAAAATAGAPMYEGQLPARYTLRQALRQWTPTLQRTLSFETGAALPRIDWDRIDARRLAQEKDDAARYVKDRVGIGDWTFCVFHRGAEMKTTSFVPDNFAEIARLSMLRPSESAPWVVLAPSGRSDLTDLPLHDPTDPQEWLVVAARQSGSELQVYRRLYRTDE